MILYKAINYDGQSIQELSCNLTTENKDVFDWETLICEAISHISHGDRKKKKDCWISATYNYKSACEYLFNPKYDFNGIAVIDLPNTSETGYIYDYSLREFGYIDKDLVRGQLVSSPNEDGIFTILDMSSNYTLYYLGSCLWLKGNTDALGNSRAFKYANKSDEVLLLGENIHFTFIKKEEVNSVLMDSSSPNNYHDRLFQNILTIISSQEQLKSLFSDSYEDGLINYIEFEKDILRKIALEHDGYFGEDNLLINEEELKERFYEEKKLKDYKELLKYYKITKYKYLSNNVKNRFYEFYKLSYAEKDVIDFKKYEIVEEYEDIPMDYFIAAYVYAGVYMNFKDQSLTSHKIWKFINSICNNKFISGTLKIETFMQDYNKGHGIYRNWNKNESRNYKR